MKLTFKIIAAFYFFLTLSFPILGAKNNETKKIALFVSADDGGNERAKLKYSKSDAESLKNILVRLSGISTSDITLLSNPSESEFSDQLISIEKHAEKFQGHYKKTEFILYYSGHSDEEGLLLGNNKITYKYIRETIKKLPFDIKIVILDSCSSGALTRTKGGKKMAPFIYNPAYDMRGEAYLTSSSSDEVSQESDKIRASFFTYYLVSGLYGAADFNRDDQVTLSEAYQFAYSKTLARTEKSIGGPQHPNFDIRMTGTGDVVITNLRSSKSSLGFDKSIGGQLFVRDSERRLIAELDKSSGYKSNIALPGGSYQIVLLQNNQILEANIQIEPNEDIILSQNDFRPASPGENESGRQKGIDDPDEKNIIKIDPEKNRITLELPDIPVLKQFNFQFLPETGIERDPVAFSVFMLGGYLQDATVFSLAGIISIIGNNMSGIQSSGIGNIVGNTQTGLQLAGIFNINKQSGKGAQISGIFNLNDRNYEGLQLSGIFNANHFFFSGTQISGIFNSAETVNGAQISGVTNLAGTVKGVQISGVLNYSENMDGFQTGLVNIASNGNGFSLGLFNLYVNEDHYLETWVDETGFIKAAYRNSTKNFHYIYGAGSDFSLDSPALIWGFGIHFPVIENLLLSFDFLTNTILSVDTNSWNFSNQPFDIIHQLRVSLNLNVFKRFALFAGIGYSFAWNRNSDSIFKPEFAESLVNTSIAGINMWPGFFIGARF